MPGKPLYVLQGIFDSNPLAIANESIELLRGFLAFNANPGVFAELNQFLVR